MFGPDLGFGGPPPLFTFFATFVILGVVGIFGFVIVRGVSTWMSNNASPVETKPATLVAKRTRVSGHDNTSARTSYYLTFEFADGQRIELPVNGREFGLLAEGDRGTLTYQGTRYHRFERMTNTR